MAFFTRYCKKVNHFFCLSFLLLLASSFAFASSNNIQIINAELRPASDYYTLSAEVEIDFDEEIEEAINKGVPLVFLVEFQIVSPREYWFDDEIVTTSHTVSLRYHALTRQYLVNRGPQQKSFETLSEAKEELAQLHDWKVVEKSLLEKEEAYNAALLIRLDQTKLPKAIQVDAIASEKWNLSSQKFEWALKDIKP